MASSQLKSWLSKEPQESLGCLDEHFDFAAAALWHFQVEHLPMEQRHLLEWKTLRCSAKEVDDWKTAHNEIRLKQEQVQNLMEFESKTLSTDSAEKNRKKVVA